MAFPQSRIVVDESYQLNVRAVGKEYQSVLSSIVRMATAWGQCKGRSQPGWRRGEQRVWDKDDDVTARRFNVSQWRRGFSFPQMNDEALTSSSLLPSNKLDPESLL
jgi:hypothetical protein